MADNPTTGRDKPGFPSSFGDIFLGIVKGGISVFNPPPDVTRIDVLKQNGTWYDAQRLQKYRDKIENTPLYGDAKQRRGQVLGKNQLLGKINDQLDTLTEGAPPGPDQTGPIPDTGVSNQQLSPTFGRPGVGGAILLGVGAGGWDEEAHQLAIKAIKEKERAARMRRSDPFGFKKPRAPLPKTNAQKLAQAGLKLLNKIPKGMLPDSELVQVGKIMARAVRVGLGPLAAQVAGTYAIEKGAAVIAARQFEQMTKILGPRDAAAVAAKQLANKGPPRRLTGRAKAVQKAAEPPRPRPPGNTGSPNQHPGASGKPPKPIAQAPGPLEKIQEVKVTAKKYATAGQIAAGAARAPRAPPGGITRSQVILGAVKALGQFGNASLFGRTPARGRGSSVVNNFAPSSQPGRQFFSQPGAKAQVTAASNCYTVCRKKSTGKKKRAKPRICVSPAKASRLGII